MGTKIERFKAIADYVSARIGIAVSDNVARKWAARPDDPLPLERFAGRVVADAQALDEWIARQRGAARRPAGLAANPGHQGAARCEGSP